MIGAALTYGLALAIGRIATLFTQMLKSNLLYSSVIEHDGRVGKQLTVFGTFLAITAAGIIGAVVFLAIGYGIAIFR